MLQGWRVALLIAFANFVIVMERNVLSLVQEPVKAAFQLSDAMLGLLNGTGFVLLYAAASIPFGLLADRADRRMLVAAALLIASIATAACGLATGVVALFLGRIALGFGAAALTPAAMSLVGGQVERARISRAVSLFTAAGSLGRSAALIGGGLLLALMAARGGLGVPALGPVAPWRGIFLIAAAIGLVAALLVSRLPEGARPLAAPRYGEALRHIGAHRAAFLLHVGASACALLLVQTLGAWGPSFFVRGFAMRPSEAGILVGMVLLVAGPLGHMAGGALTDWRQARGDGAPAAPVLMLGMATTLVLLALLAQAQGLTAALILFAAATFAGTMALPASLAGLQMLAPDPLRGRINALFVLVTTLVAFGAGPPLAGLAADLMGGPAMLGRALALVMGLFALLGIALALLSRRPFAKAVC